MVKLTLKYILFAAIATSFNLATQKIIGDIYVGFLNYWVALACGTLVGLVVKYVLDKKYIFYYKVASKKEDSQKFLIYSLFGVATTGIFWGFQTGFYLLFPQYPDAKYVGAVIGLAIGYFVKYNLDKRFVFKQMPIAATIESLPQ